MRDFSRPPTLDVDLPLTEVPIEFLQELLVRQMGAKRGGDHVHGSEMLAIDWLVTHPLQFNSNKVKTLTRLKKEEFRRIFSWPRRRALQKRKILNL